ncbi:MAG TPA: bifunctional phosphoglucose/phosphomannose isomerase [bacterium]|nr:bifunctional phosphoglucose/phosphomannose isomerase [bacterium]
MKLKEIIEMTDKENMLEKLVAFAEQCREAYCLADSLNLEAPGKILFCGMGGSAIGGDIIKAVCNNSSSIPVFVNRDYIIPSWVDKDTLVIIMSYSGNTEETISAFKKGRKSGCKLLCLSSNGKIEALSLKCAVPFVRIPSGYPPRCAFGYLFFPCYRILGSFGAVKPLRPSIFNMIEKWINEFSPDKKDNMAIKLAEMFHDKVPLLYSNNSLQPALLRWKTQIAENSKSFSFVNALPEMNHNEIMAWRYPEKFIKNAVPAFIEAKKEHPRIKLRFEITKEIISRVQHNIVTVKAEGNSLTENLLYLVILGDWISFYLAIFNKTDPAEIDEINILKKQLGGK